MLKTIKTKSTYEAAFYMLWGGKFANVRKTVLNKREADKKGCKDLWTITISDIEPWVIETWKTGHAYGNITGFVNVRTKLKKRIKREFTTFQ